MEDVAEEVMIFAKIGGKGDGVVRAGKRKGSCLEILEMMPLLGTIAQQNIKGIFCIAKTLG